MASWYGSPCQMPSTPNNYDSTVLGAPTLLLALVNHAHRKILELTTNLLITSQTHASKNGVWRKAMGTARHGRQHVTRSQP